MTEPSNPQGGTQPNPTPTPNPSPSEIAPTREAAAPAGGTLLNDPPASHPPGEAKPAGAPETYSEFKAPEGFTLDKAALEEATPIFKKHGLSQEAAQEFIDYYAKRSGSAAEEGARLLKEQNDAWVSEIKADPEIGGKLDEVKTRVSKMLDGLGNAKLATEFRQAMDYTGAGNNPAFIRVMNAIAKQLTEGSHIRGNSASPMGQSSRGQAMPTAAKALYPDLA